MAPYTNKESVAKLNLYHKAFKNLDEVTFSRWRNGKIIPSNKKIALIILFFNDNYIEFIKKISLKPTTKKLDKLIKNKEIYLSNPYLSFTSNLQSFEFNHIDELPNFLPTQAKKNMLTAITSIYNSIKKIVLIRGEQSYSCSFIVKIESPIYWDELKIELSHKYYIINPPSFHTNMNHHTDTIYLQMIYLCEHLNYYIKNAYAIFSVRTKVFDDYYHTLGYSYLKQITINNRKYYIYEGRVIDILTSDRVIDILRSY
ncbi:TPA: hypothetical protein ACX6MG_003437 [Photobacterium damselae]